nr:MAG TPA: hypothetical protein [Caudoviricetes sp.]
MACVSVKEDGAWSLTIKGGHTSIIDRTNHQGYLLGSS